MPTKQAIEDDKQQYSYGGVPYEELEQKYPDRPKNDFESPPSHTLLVSLFNPLSSNRASNAKKGPPGAARRHNPHDVRRNILERFFSQWRKDVGKDIYPVMRLIIPDKDRERAMYGLKEKAIAKLLVRLMNIANTEDGNALNNWRLPGQTAAARMAGDFAGRCYEVLKKRPMRSTYGDMKISEVNMLLDKLSGVSKEDQQLPIFTEFYERMNPEELMWLIRIILRQMKVGASEKTFLDMWHPDGEALFNVSSSLRKVCWDLTDPSKRLDDDEAGISLMQCFQPQLAQFQMHSFQKMVDNMRPTDEDPEYWIEEKLDGERMQLHMEEDDSKPGGKSFKFWSRKAKDYTYLYGNGLEDDNSALTRHLKEAFDPGVRNLILDGEMITWDPVDDSMVAFGTLKTAALSAKENPWSDEPRPLFRVFDLLYLNDEPLTKYTLRDRRATLERVVKNVHRRLEKHTYEAATSVSAIEPLLRKVVAEKSEGLVLKNPRSAYRLNSRNDDWMKVKPEYMSEFGESLDCLIIAGFYGSGRRGGRISSYLCGLRVDPTSPAYRGNPMLHWSFFKVGGGFKEDDYAAIRHHTDGKWIDWDARNPPTEYIELGGGVPERPDVWIKPSDSIVVCVKAAAVVTSEDYRFGYTLRFPRFQRLRTDKAWDSALSIAEFKDLKAKVDEEAKKKEFEVDNSRKRAPKKVKREILIAGNDQTVHTPYAGPSTGVFEGLNFCVLGESVAPVKKSKAEIEQMVTKNGGQIWQNPLATEDMVIVADKKLVKVASLVKTGERDVVRAKWVFDCVEQSERDAARGRAGGFLVPMERGHLFAVGKEGEERFEGTVDEWGDSYARDVEVGELGELMKGMEEAGEGREEEAEAFMDELMEKGLFDDGISKGWLFRGVKACLVPPDAADDVAMSVDLAIKTNDLKFGGGKVVEELEPDQGITHIIAAKETPEVKDLRKEISTWPQGTIPRIVGWQWVADSWKEGTRLDEERYAL